MKKTVLSIALFVCAWAVYAQTCGRLVVNPTTGKMDCVTDPTSVYNARRLGAVGDARSLTDGAITSGQVQLTSAAAAFTLADVGKGISVVGAGAAGGGLVTTVAAYVSSTAVDLTDSASTTVSSATFTLGTDDTASLQTTLNLPGSKLIYIPPGKYYVSNTLAIPSNTTVLGAGRGATTLIPQSGSIAGRDFNGVIGYSVLCSAATDNVRIANLTVDLATNKGGMNGIQSMQDGAFTRSTNAVIQGVEVKGWDTHQYHIWAHGSDYVKILDNFLDGGVSSGTTQVGIELWAATGALVSQNTILNSAVGINLFTGAAEVLGYDGTVSGAILSQNYIETAYIGIAAGASYYSGVSRDIIGFKVIGNTVRSASNYGISVTAEASSTVNAVTILGNTIEDCSEGVHVFGSSANIAGLSISDNVIQRSTTATTGAISVSTASNTLVRGNVIKTSVNNGIHVTVCVDCLVSGNVIDDPSVLGINSVSNTRTVIESNSISNSGSTPIIVAGGSDNVVRNNVVYVAVPGAFPINIDSGDRGFLVGNKYMGKITNAAPFRNNSTNPNIGAVTFAATATTAVVTTELVTGSTVIRLHQEAGIPQPYAISRTPGTSFTITIPSAAVGDEVFRWELVN